MQRDNSAENRLAFMSALCVLRDDAGTNLDLLAKTERARKDRATSDTTLEIINLCTRFVDVEGTNDDEFWF